jgi:hypothetical protein
MRQMKKALGFALWVLAANARSSGAADAGAPRPPQVVDCRAELDYVAAFLLANDAGVRAHGWSAYPDRAAKRLAEQRNAARAVTSPAACVEVLERFFAGIRTGHLGARVVSEEPPSFFDPARAPKIELRRLSAGTVYLGVPSFGSGIREQLERAIEANQAEIRSARTLIIDVRKNGGGSDSGFAPLLGLLGPATYRSAGADILVTAATLSGWSAILKIIPRSEERDRRSVAKIIERMTIARKEGQRRGLSEAWLPLATADEVTVVAGETVKARPDRVWVMTGSGCGSSCEEFVLAVKQNPRVTLVGRRTAGSLDASNLRPARTPSGAIEVWYATTYVRRPPGKEVDDVGIPPSIVLRAPAGDAGFAREVEQVQKMAEQGRPGS